MHSKFICPVILIIDGEFLLWPISIIHHSLYNTFTIPFFCEHTYTILDTLHILSIYIYLHNLAFD